MAVLLKTTSVRVSFIQIMQVRVQNKGKSVWKSRYIGDVSVPKNGRNGLVLERYARNGGPVHGEGCGVPQNGTPRDTVHLHHRPPPASTGYRRPPPASTGSCSSSLHRALLHRLLFNHPSTGTPPPSTVHPALHHTTGSCS